MSDVKPLEGLDVDWLDGDTVIVDLSDGTTVTYTAEEIARLAPNRFPTSAGSRGH